MVARALRATESNYASLDSVVDAATSARLHTTSPKCTFPVQCCFYMSVVPGLVPTVLNMAIISDGIVPNVSRVLDLHLACEFFPGPFLLILENNSLQKTRDLGCRQGVPNAKLLTLMENAAEKIVRMVLLEHKAIPEQLVPLVPRVQHASSAKRQSATAPR